jgi:hypothetical protein
VGLSQLKTAAQEDQEARASHLQQQRGRRRRRKRKHGRRRCPKHCHRHHQYRLLPLADPALGLAAAPWRFCLFVFAPPLSSLRPVEPTAQGPHGHQTRRAPTKERMASTTRRTQHRRAWRMQRFVYVLLHHFLRFHHRCHCLLILRRVTFPWHHRGYPASLNEQ